MRIEEKMNKEMDRLEVGSYYKFHDNNGELWLTDFEGLVKEEYESFYIVEVHGKYGKYTTSINKINLNIDDSDLNISAKKVR